MRLSSVAIPALSVALSAATALVISSRDADADGIATTDTVPRRIAYSGTLEADGGAYSGEVEMRFTLWDGDTALWTEEYTGARPVIVHAGTFEVLLGQYAAGLETAIAGADALTLGIEVRIVGAPDWIPLAGRQAVTPVPYSMWSMRGANFTVAQDLAVGRDATVGRNLDVVGTSRLRGTVTADANIALNGGATVGGAGVSTNTLNASGNASVGGTLGVTGNTTLSSALTVSRNVSAGAWTPPYANWASFGSGAGGAGIYNDDGSYDALMLVGNTAGGGGRRRIRLYDDVNIPSGGLNVSGTITANSVQGNILANNFSVSGEYFLTARSEGLYSNINMTSTSNSFCFLTRVRAPDDSGEDDLVQCNIGVNGSVWQLQLYTSSDDNWNTDCVARCFTFR